VLLLGALLSPPMTARAADEADPSHESEVIEAAGKRPQPVAEVASPVTLITADEIHAHGFHTLGEALQWVRGMYVTSDRVYSYLGIRGIQRPGDFNNKVLLALDGHVMNGNVFGDAYMDASFGIDLDLIERIEVVHGPTSDLYGNDAVLALVNVVMRRPTEGYNGLVAGRAGSASRRSALASLTAAKPGKPRIFASGSWLDARGLDLYYSEFDSPSTNNGMAIDADGEESKAFFGTIDWRGLRLATKFNQRTKRIPTGSFGTLFGDNRYRAYDGHDFVELSGMRPMSSDLDLSARAYWDRAHYHATYVYESGGEAVLNQDSGNGDLVGAEVRGLWSPASRSHAVTLAIESQFKAAADLLNYDIDPYAPYLDASGDRTLLASYVQDRIRLMPTLHLVAGVRADRWSDYDVEWSPSVGITWIDPRNTEWKLNAARGFRMPTAYETLYETPEVLRNPELGPEHVETVQGTVSRAFGPLDMLVTGYASELRGVIDLVEVDSTGTVRYANADRVSSVGVEAEMNLLLAPGNHLRFSFARQSSTLRSTDAPLTNSPAWDVSAMFRRDPTRGPLGVGVGLRYLSPRQMRTGRETAAALVADARVARRFGSRVEAGVEVKNLFDARYGDPASGEFVQEQILRDPREIFFTLSLSSNLGL
jgi:iron complex outermembrane receptor protein